MNKINTDHRYYYEDGSIVNFLGKKMISVYQCTEEMNILMDEIKNYKTALHDAIDRPKGVVPESAENLFDQKYYDYLSHINNMFDINNNTHELAAKNNLETINEMIKSYDSQN